MPSDDYVPAACVRDAVAAIRDDGVLAATNDAMRGWIAQFGGALDALPLSSDDRAQLEAGDLVLLHAADCVWELRRWVHDGAVWLTAADVTDREGRQSTLFSTMRCRALGSLAASLSHDLNNQFNSALALSSELGLLAQMVENRVVGAPCGVMDQMASLLGRANKLLALLCQVSMEGSGLTLGLGGGQLTICLLCQG